MSSAAGADESPSTTPTEFVLEEFETTVAESAVEDLAERITEIVRGLRAEVVSDDRLEELLWGQPGPDILHGSDITEQGDPEPFTQRTVIEPLFDALGYPDFTTEASGLTDEQRQKADYLFSLREYDDIDSKRLPVEAEPLNKKLDQQKHGIGQVKDWLDTYSFGAEFGIATDGMRWVLIKYDRERYQYDTLAEVNLQPVFIAAFENVTGRQVSLDEWLEESNEDTLDGFVRSFGFENFRAIASDARSIIKETKSEITDEFYDEYVRRVFGVLDESESDGERTEFSLVGDGIDAPAAATGDDVRLFAVELMNRLIFTKFLEDKGLVPETLLADFANTYNPRTYPQSLYETYFEPLFFGVLDTRPSERSSQITNVDFYTDVPYLNGGLFRPTENEERGFTDKDFDVRDGVLESLIRFLESYSFSVGGGPEDLDPSVLGNVFEKTINYLTGDGTDAKKQLGAFYTPDEITRFCAKETVQPWLLERFKETLVQDLGRKQVDMDRYDDVFALIEGAVPHDVNVVEALLADIDQFRALDPACGSGHFLTSVLGEIVAVRKALYENHPEDPQTWELRKQTVIENIYGVDIVQPAVEIAKLRLWLSIIGELTEETAEMLDADELALPNISFNIRQGNSLIGYTGFPEQTEAGEYTFERWSEESVRNRYEDIIEAKRKFRAATDRETANEYQQEAFELLEADRGDLHENVLRDFERAGIEGLSESDIAGFDPFHWVLEFAEVYAKGGFDVVVGNPPWDVLTVSRDDFFSQYDRQFRTKTPDQKAERQSDLLENERVAEAWESYQRSMEVRSDYFTKSAAYELQRPTVAGQTNTNENDLSALFLERVFNIARDDGYVAQVLPGNIFNGSATKDLRTQLLDESEIQTLVAFENHGIFPEIDNRYQFGVLVFENTGRTETLRGTFQQRELDVLEDIESHTVEMPRRVLSEYSPEARIFPFVTSQAEVDVLNELLKYPSVSDSLGDKWQAEAHRELILAYDDDRLIESTSPAGDYPVYGGANFYQYAHDSTYVEDLQSPKFWSVEEDGDTERSAKRRVREKAYNGGDLKRALYEEFGGPDTSKSQKGFVNDLLGDNRDKPLSTDDVLLDCSEYRIVFRDVANATNERTMIATVLPKGIVCLDSVRTIKPFALSPEEDQLSEYPLHGVYERIFTDEELFVATGLLNSLPYDYLLRTKVSSHIPKYKFEESQLPRLTAGDDWFEYIWTRAARLNCYGEAFAEMRERLGGINPATEPGERKRLRAEIDAAAFHAYGLDPEKTQFILDDFHRVQNPRLMTDDYFDLVSEKYDDLVADTPEIE